MLLGRVRFLCGQSRRLGRACSAARPNIHLPKLCRVSAVCAPVATGCVALAGERVHGAFCVASRRAFRTVPENVAALRRGFRDVLVDRRVPHRCDRDLVMI